MPNKVADGRGLAATKQDNWRPFLLGLIILPHYVPHISKLLRFHISYVLVSQDLAPRIFLLKKLFWDPTSSKTPDFWYNGP